MKEYLITALIALFLTAGSGLGAAEVVPEPADDRVLEVVSATKQGRMPSSMLLLRDRFSKELEAFVIEKKVDSKREMLALLVTMDVIDSCARDAVTAALGDEALAAAKNAGYPELLAAAKAAARTALTTAKVEAPADGVTLVTPNDGDPDARPWEPDWSAQRIDARAQVWAAGSDLAMKNAASQPRDALAYRVVEWTVLEGIYQAPRELLDATYTATLGALAPGLGTKPFSDGTEWLSFRTENFGNIKNEVGRLLIPYLDVFDSLMYVPTILQFHMCYLSEDRPAISILPLEIIWIISCEIAKPLRKK